MRTLLVSFLALAACSSKSMPGDDGGGGGDGSGGGDTAQIQQDYDDVAASLGANLNVSELAAMLDSINMAYGRAPAGFTENPPGTFTGTRGGLTIAYKVYCRDLQDLIFPCRGQEDHEHVRVTFSGTLSTATAAVDGLTRDGSWIVRDVITPMPRVGGHGSTGFTSSMSTGTYDVTFTDDFGHVRFDALAPTLPTSGTMDLMLTIRRSRETVGDRDFAVTAHIEFVGGDAATIGLDGMHSYDLTVSTGAVVRIN